MNKISESVYTSSV